MTVTPPDALDRLHFLKSILGAAGIDSLTGLGTMQFSGTLVPIAGVASPRVQNLRGRDVLVVGARKGRAELRSAAAAGRNDDPWEPFGTTASYVNAHALPAGFPLDLALWTAREIVLADDTVVVLSSSQKHLTIVAERLIVGRNVTFSWERTPFPSLNDYPKLPTPPRPPVSGKLAGIRGVDGVAGISGKQGFAGAAGPSVEVWTLNLRGRPSFDLRGQDGGRGGAGQDGQDGGPGSEGWASHSTKLACRHGPGNGGDGGNAGAGGSGGPGGAGGTGGQLRMYAPSDVLAEYQRGYLADASPGAPGAGGRGGRPGLPGQGGPVGAYLGHCEPDRRNPRRPGVLGFAAPEGREGPRGQEGMWRSQQPLGFIPIGTAEFQQKLTAPGIVNIEPDRAKAGQVVTLTGINFSSTDSVFLGAQACPTTYVADTLMYVTVPPVRGGFADVQVRQADGTASNLATLFVVPTLDPVQVTGGRIKPGSTVRLTGGGFAPGMIVRVNEQDMPDVRVLDPGQLECRVVRPTVVTEQAAGEPVTVRVLLPDGTSSNEVPAALDTYRVLVLGDSIQWGQGLRPHEKISAHVVKRIKELHSGIGVYVDSYAHSGAPIGLSKDGTPDETDERTLTPPDVDGEVPTTYPTIWQQCLLQDAGDTIDLVLVDGGINDIDLRVVLNPFTDAKEIRALADLYCRQHMQKLLDRIATLFPNAEVVVTAYYPIVSEQSDLTVVHVLLIAAGVGLAAVNGALLGGVLSADRMAKVVGNSREFSSSTLAALLAATEGANETLRSHEKPPRFSLAVPAFSPANAALGPQTWLWGIKADLSPEDPVAGARASACELAADRTGFHCRVASVGHPKPAGAVAYAQAVNDKLTGDLFAMTWQPLQVVAVQGAVVRTAPRRSAALVRPLRPGTTYQSDAFTDEGELIGSSRWYHLAAASGYGWVHSSGVTPIKT